jgi:outer membrane lipoprotein-sorting protein
MRGIRIGGCLLLALGIASLARATTSAEGTLDEIRAAHARVRDLVTVVERSEIRKEELRRMRGNASGALEFETVKLQFMAPDRLRIEGKRGILPVTVVENGNTQVIRLGPGIKKKNDLTGLARRKQGGLEFGLLSDQVWQDYQVTMAGTDTFESTPCVVLRLQARGDRPGSSFQKLWVDATTHRVVRRDRYTGDEKLKSRQVFREPFRTPAGTWLSRRIEVYSQYGKFAGALTLTDARVNQGLAESLFRT